LGGRDVTRAADDRPFMPVPFTLGDPKSAPAAAVSSTEPTSAVPSDSNYAHSPLMALVVGKIQKAARDQSIVDLSGRDRSSGGSGITPFHDAPPAGVLIGFDISYDTLGGSSYVTACRPIFLTSTGKVTGNEHGTLGPAVTHIEAKPGYAVGAVRTRKGLYVDALSITYMRVTANGLDPKDSYQSANYGGPGGSDQGVIGGDGSFIVGIHGHEGTTTRKQLYSLGLMAAPAR
jgi:hypothetical protein